MVAAEPQTGLVLESDRTYDFLAGGGEMGALMRALDWSATPAGSLATWPQSLRTVVRLILNTGHPMYIFWGQAGACFYNDAYRRSIGPERHPGSLGRPAREVWDEIWDIIGPQIEQVMAGRGATWHENQLVPITRNGRREDVYWTYSYSPIDDETAPNGVGGVLVTCSETTQRVVAERRLAQMFEQGPSFMAMLEGPEHRIELANPSYLELVGERDVVGKTVADILPDAVQQGYLDLLDTVFRTGRPFSSAGARFAAQSFPGSSIGERFVDFVYQPIKDHKGKVTGIFVEGSDVTERKRAEDHIQFLMHEMTHRSKNLLSVIQAIARRTAQTTTTLEEFDIRFGQRLQGLAASHDVLVVEGWRGAPLAELLRQQLAPFVDAKSPRLESSGPSIVVNAQAAQAIGLAIHELATNATKYGALSVPAGKVEISWTLESNAGGEQELRLNWTERNGPPVRAPTRKGFGHMVIDSMIARSLSGRVTIDFAADGLRWSVWMPAANLIADAVDPSRDR